MLLEGAEMSHEGRNMQDCPPNGGAPDHPGIRSGGSSSSQQLVVVKPMKQPVAEAVLHDGEAEHVHCKLAKEGEGGVCAR